MSQELHALAFASESIRKIDLTNVLGVYGSPHTRGSTDYTTFYKNSSELLRPLMMLSRGHLLTCHSFVMSQNPVSPTDIDELGENNPYEFQLNLANSLLRNSKYPGT